MTERPTTELPTVRRPNTVWLSPGATSFSCLCEECVETARDARLSFHDTVRHAIVRGPISAAAVFLTVRCPRGGHEVVLRRVERPATLAQPDPRQLQLA